MTTSSGRIMGLDYGSKTVGVALTDPLGIIAQPFETITRQSENKLRRTLARIEEIAGQYDVRRIVLGLPVNMDGTMGDRVEKTMEFKEKLENRLHIPIVLKDERLTSVEADEDLSEMKIPHDQRKKYIDQLAAVYILEDYMRNG